MWILDPVGAGCRWIPCIRDPKISVNESYGSWNLKGDMDRGSCMVKMPLGLVYPGS